MNPIEDTGIYHLMFKSNDEGFYEWMDYFKETALRNRPHRTRFRNGLLLGLLSGLFVGLIAFLVFG